MALSAATVLEVRTGGSDTNGGGYHTGGGGTDWTLQNGAQYAVVDGVTAGTTTITSATANFGTDVVGNLIYVSGGTGSVVADWYEIISRTNSTTIVVDRSTGLTAGTGVTLNIGGALASPSIAALISAKTAGIAIWIKAGTYTISSASTGVTGGCVQAVAGGASSSVVKVEGYNSSRGDKGTAPLLQASGISTFTVVTQGNISVWDNVSIDCAGLAGSTGFKYSAAGSRARCSRITVSNATTNGFNVNNGLDLYRCKATGCSGIAFAGAQNTFSYCEAYGNTASGFSSTTVSSFIGCISSGNTGVASDGFSTTSGVVINCTAYGNGRHGFIVAGNVTTVFINCIAEGNGVTAAGNGFFGIDTLESLAAYCAVYSNNSANFASITQENCITGTGSFFTNAASGDFSLNNTAGAGAALRAAGYPGLMPRGTTTGYADIGAAQHQDSGGGATYTGFFQS